MSAHLLLAGYFGSGNLGDDAILMGFLEGIKDKHCSVKAICGAPESLMRDYGVSGVGRLDLSRIQDEIETCDALVFPGGSILQDVTSVRSVAYYSDLVRRAKKANKRVVFLGQGIGPLNRMLGRRFAGSALRQADVITVRDQASMEVAKKLGVTKPIKVTADTAFLLPEPKLADAPDYGIAGKPTVGIAPRPWGRDRNKKVTKLFGDLMRLLYEGGYLPVLVEMDHEEDGPLITEVGKSMGGKAPEVRGLRKPSGAQERFARMHAVIAMRLHAGILSASVGVPPMMVSYDPKVTAFAQQLGQRAIPKLEETTAQAIFGAFQDFIKDRDRTAEIVRKRREEFADRARANVEALDTILGSSD